MRVFSHLGYAVLILRSGIDFDDAEYGFKEEDKDPFKVTFLSPGIMLYY